MTETSNLTVIPSPNTVVIKKNEKEEYRVSLKEYRGFKYLNVHLWYEGGDGKMLPGKGDVSIGITNGRARALLAAMEKVLTDAGL